MTFPFRIVEHIIPGQHIREHPHALKGRQEAALKLAIKQYIPLDQTDPIPENAVTIIGSHGNGFPKETYEPLWEDLYAQLNKRSIPVRSIWIADVSNQGASGILNEHVQGDNTLWHDHSRDLLHMVNHFRDDIARPIIGVAHSMGCAHLIQLSIMHPRLLSTLILYEPVIFGEPIGGPNPAISAVLRRDLWPSRDKAEMLLRKGFARCDPRVVDRYLRFGLRPVPTPLYDPENAPDIPKTAVTLTTSKHQEAWAYTIPNLEPESAGLNDLLLPDWDPVLERPAPFSRPEAWAAFRNLPFVRPSVFWVYGGRSWLSPPAAQDSKLRATGTAIGGSGGVTKGMADKTVSPKATHLIVFEEVGWCAEVAATWLEKWFERYLKEEEFWRTYQSKKSDPEMLRNSEASIRVAKVVTGSHGGIAKGKL
ncbi:toxin biosynthesis protein, putative [Aspergillus udagawae]|nr:toxin biosynthesis protein, putative [Aspergillus udagawae]